MTSRYQNLVPVSLLARHCSEPDWVVLDCRFDLSDPLAGDHAWQSGHIPGAVYADLEADLSSPATPAGGRHPLPQAGHLARTLSDWGIDRQTQVIAYDDAGGAYAARAWWLLRWLGHRDVALLDGGLKAWRREGLPLTREVEQRSRRDFDAEPADWMHVDADEVAAALQHGGIVLDARAPERFLGDQEPLDTRAGHIPGAHNYPFMANLDRDGRFLAVDELRLCFEAARCDRPASELISMCGSGVTACHNLLAMEIAGLGGARLYPGSWSEWSADSSRPAALGPDA